MRKRNSSRCSRDSGRALRATCIIRGITLLCYLDVSFRGDAVPQALNGPHQVRAMLLQGLCICRSHNEGDVMSKMKKKKNFKKTKCYTEYSIFTSVTRSIVNLELNSDLQYDHIRLKSINTTGHSEEKCMSLKKTLHL